MFRETKVLVAGGTGFIGANVVQRLLAAGSRVRSTVHRRPPRIFDPGIEYVQADLTTMDDCRRVVDGMDYVFMCAASTSGAAVMTSTPLVHVTSNVVMNAQLMDAAYYAGVKKYLFISSSAAYPPTGSRPVAESEMFLGDPYDTYYSVGWMKRYVEVLCLMYAMRLTPPMATVVIRPSNAYGPLDNYDLKTSHMTAALIRKVVERQAPLEVWGTGDDVRDLIYIDDLVEGIVKAFEGTASYSAVNIASGVAYSVKEVLQTILRTDGYANADVRFNASRPSTIPVRLVDVAKARSEFGFEAAHGLEDGIRETLAWYRRSVAGAKTSPAR
jgi:GDP-L-fucose synthase